MVLLQLIDIIAVKDLVRVKTIYYKIEKSKCIQFLCGCDEIYLENTFLYLELTFKNIQQFKIEI